MRSFSQLRLLSVAVLHSRVMVFRASGKGRLESPSTSGHITVASSTRIRHAEMERPSVGVATPLIFAVTNVLFRGFRPVPAVERYAAEYAVIFGQSPVATRCT